MKVRRIQMTTKSCSRIGLSLVLALAVGMFTVLPASAVAQGAINDPTAAVYGDDDGGSASAESQGATGSGGSSGGTGSSESSGLSSPIGSLPFTGMDLIILAGVAFVLTGTGFALRRASMPRGPHA
jgi:hypothetical protein